MACFDICEDPEPHIQHHINHILEVAFGRTFDASYLKDTHLYVILEKQKRAVALMQEHHKWLYLDKLAALPNKEGLGVQLLHASIRFANEKGYAGMFWRARPEKAQWYMRHPAVQGCITSGPWIVMWAGTFTREELSQATAYASSLPRTI